MSSGLLFIVSAPSGAGKSTVLRQVMQTVPALFFSVSHTTRKPRPGEQDGRQYHFIDQERFSTMITAGAFLEWAEVHGNCYGTSRQAVLDQLQQGLDVVVEIDVQGAALLQECAGCRIVRIFLAPPDLFEMERRLRDRGTESEEHLAIRLANARQEMQAVADYEYLVVNDQLEDAVLQLSAIIYAERARARRLPAGTPVRLEIPDA